MLAASLNGPARPHPKPEKTVAERLADIIIDLAAHGVATRENIIAAAEEKGLTSVDFDLNNVEAFAIARKKTFRRIEDSAADDLARETVESTNRTLLVRVPVGDICQLWSELRNAGATPVEATLRITASLEQAVAQ